MYNLLPQQEQRWLVREYRLRLAALSLFFLTAIAALSVVALIPSLFLSFTKVSLTTGIEKALQNDPTFQSKDNSSAVLRIAAAKVTALQSTAYKPYSYELIGDVMRLKPPTIRITSLHIERTASGHTLNIAGRAEDRDALLGFTRTLGTEKVFSDVKLPVSSFAAATDINFSLMIEAK